MTNTNANAIAAILVGAYLLAATLRPDGQKRVSLLLGLLAQEGGFLKWSIALGALWFLASRPELGSVGVGLIGMAFLLLAIKIANDPTILGSIAQAWKMLPTSRPGVSLPGDTHKF